MNAAESGAATSPPPTPMIGLQWGRRMNAAERIDDGLLDESDGDAQWGRRMNAAERLYKRALSALRELMLQWGRRMNAAESFEARVSVDVLDLDLLQWGRRMNAAESLLNVKGQHGDSLASMGPPHERGGESAATSAPPAPASSSFNGAAA